MAEADIPAQSPLGKKSIPSYEEQLATIESMMTCYDTPITQAAGYVRDLLRTIIALQQREISLPSDVELIDLMLKGARLSTDKTANRQNMHGALRALKLYLRPTVREPIKVSQELPRECCRKCERSRMDAEAAQGIFPIRLMVCCPICGNKRCPKASDHDLACTGSNEPGQEGSVY